MNFTDFCTQKETELQQLETQLTEEGQPTAKIDQRLTGFILMHYARVSDTQRDLLILNSNNVVPFDKCIASLRTLDKPEQLAQGHKASTKISLFQNGSDDADADAIGSPRDELSDDGEFHSSESGSIDLDPDREYTEAETIQLIAYGSAYKDVRKELQKRRTNREDPLEAEVPSTVTGSHTGAALQEAPADSPQAKAAVEAEVDRADSLPDLTLKFDQNENSSSFTEKMQKNVPDAGTARSLTISVQIALKLMWLARLKPARAT